ncbi:Major facilitator superfamily domain containing protein [Hyaloscypha variabilis]
MENQHTSVSEDKVALDLDVDIRPAAPPMLVPNASEFELAVLGEGERPADIVSRVNPRSRIRVAAILVALNLSMFVSALDQTIIATAIPTIVSSLGTASGYVWIGGSYLLAGAAAGPIWTKFSDIWGRKPILLGSTVMFFCSSIICARAQSMKMLIVGRSLQGTASGGLFQLVMIVISDIFSMRERSLFMGLTAVMWTLAGAVGPVMGGAFAQTIGWRWCFWINLPISGSAFLLILGFLDVHHPKTGLRDGIKAVDWFGSLSILGLTLMLLLGLDFGGATFPWNSPQVICLLVFGSLMSVFFLYSEKCLARHPLMVLDIFRERSNIACVALGFFHGFISIAMEYYAPLYFQSAMGASPLRSGVLILPLIVAQSLVAILAGIIIHRTGRYLEIIRLGPIIMTIGIGLYVRLSATSSMGEIIGFQILAGIGSGVLYEPPLLALQAFVPQDNIATASSSLGFVRSLASAMSVVIGGVIFQNSMDIRVDALKTPPASLPSNITDLLSNGQAAANIVAVNLIQDEGQKMLIKEAYAWSLRNIWIFYVCISALCILSTVFVKKQVLSKEHEETKTGIKSIA